MTEIFKKGNFTYYCIEEDKSYNGLFFWYDDGKKQTTSYVQLKGTLDFIVKSKNLNYVRRKIKHHLKVKEYTLGLGEVYAGGNLLPLKEVKL